MKRGITGLAVIYFLCGASFAEESKVKAYPPFYSRVESADGWQEDFLWPLYSRSNLGAQEEQRWLWFGYSRSSLDSPRAQRGFLPFWISGQNQKGERYQACFPFMGRVEDILFYDEVSFVLFPLYSHTQVGTLRTQNILWPLFSRSVGEGITRARVFPLYGYSKKEGMYDHRFICWPLFTAVRMAEGPYGGFVLFPFYGQKVTEEGKTHWVLPPLFRYSNETNQKIITAPWPFIQYAEGKIDRRYLWPIWGKKSQLGKKSGFALWPLVHWQKQEDKTRRQHAIQVAPFYKSVQEERKGVQASKAHRWQLWPIASGESSAQQHSWKMLSLWPFESAEVIERNWAPCWHLLSYERQAKDIEWSLLHGLLSFKREESRKSLQIGYLINWSWGASSSED
jgi:hypothetical protein